jgi:hypothetical protein
MADNDTPQGTPLIPDDLHEWSADELMLPSNAKQPETPEPDTLTGDDDEEQPVTPPPAAEDEPEVEYVPDPGEYTPADYSFEVTTYDEDGKHPKTHKVDSVESWDKLMETDPNFGSSAALMKATRLASKMESNLDSDYKAWAAKKAEFDKVTQEDSAQSAQLNTWEKELNYLVERGDLPKIAKKYQGANWSDPEVAKQEGVKQQVELLNFMKKENALRTKAGLQPMTSMLDVFNAYSIRKPKTEDEAPKRTPAKERQAASAKIAPGNAVAAASAPKGIMVGRGGSLDDIGRTWDL